MNPRRAVVAALLTYLLATNCFADTNLLAKVDRSIAKEPAYQGKPKYCLLVFGTNIQNKVWLVTDGERLYVDANGNGDLTARTKLFNPTNKREFETTRDNKRVTYRDMNYKVGDLNLPGGTHRDVIISRYQIGDPPAEYVIHLKVNGTIEQYAGWSPLFKESRTEAPVINFGAPLEVRPVRYNKIDHNAKKPELHIMFVTPGLGRGSTAYLAFEAIPKSIEPMCTVVWPGSGEGRITDVPMTDRC